MRDSALAMQAWMFLLVGLICCFLSQPEAARRFGRLYEWCRRPLDTRNGYNESSYLAKSNCVKSSVLNHVFCT